MAIMSYMLRLVSADLVTPLNLMRVGTEPRAPGEWVSFPGGSGTVVVTEYFGGANRTLTAAAGISSWRLKIRGVVSTTALVCVGTEDQIIPQNPGVRTAVSLAALLALTGVQDGEEVSIPHRGYFRRALNVDVTANMVADDVITYAAAVSEGGFWVRDQVRGAAGANHVPNWICDPDLGDDEADGQIDPVKELDEVLLRIGRQTLKSTPAILANGNSVYITLLGDYDQKEYDFFPDLADEVNLAILGTKTYKAPTYTFSAVTPWADATGVFSSYTAAGTPNWTTLSDVELYVRIDDGVNEGNKGQLVKDLTGGAFRANMINQLTGEAFEPSVSETFRVYTPAKLGGKITARPTGRGWIWFESLDMGVVGENHSIYQTSGKCAYVASILRGLNVEGECSQAYFDASTSYDLHLYAFSLFHGHVFRSVGGVALAIRGGANAQIQSRCFVYGGTVGVGHVDEGPGHLRLEAPLVCEAYAPNAIEVTEGSTVIAHDYVNARDSASGASTFLLHEGARVRFATGKRPKLYGTLPSKGASGEWSIGGDDKTGTEVGTAYTHATNQATVTVLSS